MFRSISQLVSKKRITINDCFKLQKDTALVVADFFKNYRHLIETRVNGSDLIITTKHKSLAQHVTINAKGLHKALREKEMNYRRIIIK